MRAKFSYSKIVDKGFGAIGIGGDLRALDQEDFNELYSAFLEYGFLIFPNQHLNEAENIDFAKRFGELEFGALPLANEHKQEDGSFNNIIPLNTQRMRTNVGNEAWHTDSTYWPISSKCAMLSALKVPSAGGETQLADARAGYDALSADLKASIEELGAYHSTEFSQGNDLGDFPKRDKSSIYHGEAYYRPLVKVHPETGRRSLLIGRHAFGIPGLSRNKSRELLARLLQVVVGDEKYVYTHRWAVGDLLVWDNRCLLHRARPYDYSQPRVLIGSRIAGDENSELAYYPEDKKAEEGRAVLDSELKSLRESHGFVS